ncbi:hypothetical protein ACET3X_001281 [Alternaria dauci]|uniref:PAT1 multi-domain protein n=1 Tax=Alternaria dauci TaxID=48095 RepID=A0ABR3UYM3_9PLEO
MPNFPWTKSNRSHQSVDNSSSGQHSPVPSVNEQVAGQQQRYQNPDGSQPAPVQLQQQQLSVQPLQPQYREQFPQRATSHRLSAHLSLGQQPSSSSSLLSPSSPQQNYQQPAGPPPASAVEAPHRGVYQGQPSPAAYAPEPKKQSLRSRIAAGVKGHKDQEAKAQKNGLGRRQSVRKSDPRVHEYQAHEDARVQQQQQQQQWHQHQGSTAHLPASNEQDEDNLDPFLQKDSNETPQVPPKDFQYQQKLQQPQQAFVPPPPPPPSHQEQYNRPPLGRASTEDSYSTQGGPAAPPPQPATDYQAFAPQNVPSPLLQNAQPHGQGGQGPQDIQQTYHLYQQSLEGAHQNTLHPQQQFASQLQPHQDQDPHQQPQSVRPLSQHQLAPPSPLQPSSYQTYDAQHTQPSDPPPTNTTPPRQSQDSMAPSAQSNARNTLRKVVDGSQHQPGQSSRESSLLSQPPAQASQGQPYRGEKQSQQVSEMGRATPPPRTSVADMTEEDVEKLQKEHDVLREKYQKVKRYFFEQQSQVHQLQNTLANQRLSLSRTSWDDSEYATRFNRLDGLIAQLSFSIRKDWKTIPQWLHVVVNKTAVETGKQEMTAVGRAFISHWLVENIFDKYFHPDLEPGFSTQLQSIVSNIRKFSPPCHSTEDEDTLAAKIINWRLATLEGLADTLRAPQATANREALTATLNEKLIASLQMHLNEPAPADLNGGVPMIIELAISIAQHLPLESREVHIEYFPPGHGIVSDFMKLESGIPALTAPIVELDDADRASIRSMASRPDDSMSIAEQEQAQLQGSQLPKEDKKRGMFGFGASKKATASPAALGKRESSLGQGGSQQSLTQHPPGSSGGPKDESPPPRVRMAVGVAVQIRGKSILIKAPVYST